MIIIQNVTKYFSTSQNPILDNIHLEIQPGEVFGIIGQSGAGKSTLLRCLNGLELPSSGDIHVNGFEVNKLQNTSLRDYRKHVGMIFQQFYLVSTKTIYQNLELVFKIHGTPKNEIYSKVMDLLAHVQLEEKAAYYPHQLSGGQKQRVSIARALAMKPQILLCDEATSALDTQTTLSILKLLKQLQQEYQLTLVMVTHQLEVVKAICDRVAVLDQGRLVEIAQVEDFFLKPTSSLGKSLVETGFKENLPAETEIPIMAKQNETQYLIRLIFDKESVNQPIMSDLVRLYPVSINIMQANIERIHQQSMGIMIILISGHEDVLNQSIQFLKQHHIKVERIHG